MIQTYTLYFFFFRSSLLKTRASIYLIYLSTTSESYRSTTSESSRSTTSESYRSTTPESSRSTTSESYRSTTSESSRSTKNKSVVFYSNRNPFARFRIVFSSSIAQKARESKWGIVFLIKSLLFEWSYSC